MAASIPASALVNIQPGVISAGGSGLDMVGLILTDSLRAPAGAVLRFATSDDVGAYFGATSAEANAATTYFGGYDGSFIKPGFVLFGRYNTAAAAAWLRGGRLALSLTQLQALSGTLTLTVNGVSTTSSTITLSTATSFSNAASIIQAGFTSPGFTVTYDSLSGAFQFTNTSTGATSTITAATGSLAAPLLLDAADGAIVSPGGAADAPGTAMDAVVAQTQDFVSFTTIFQPVSADMLAFATWNSGKNNRYLYAGWTNDAAATSSTDSTSVGYLIRQAGLSGTALIWTTSYLKAAFLLGAIASIDFTRTNGRTNLAFRSEQGLVADVTNATIAADLKANGYNFYGAYAPANDLFIWFQPGQVSGDFAWLDSYINQIWMNNAFQLDVMVALGQVGQIPYNDDGYQLLEAVLLDPITDAVNFGAIRAGVTLTNAQAAYVNGLAGKVVSDAIFQRGWYLSIVDPGGSVRAQRGSPVCTFFYTDGQSVQQINLSSLMVV
jgi:hypothetical protein